MNGEDLVITTLDEDPEEDACNWLIEQIQTLRTFGFCLENFSEMRFEKTVGTLEIRVYLKVTEVKVKAVTGQVWIEDPASSSNLMERHAGDVNTVFSLLGNDLRDGSNVLLDAQKALDPAYSHAKEP